MPAPSWENLGEFFTDDFTVVVTLAGRQVRGHWREHHAEVQLGASMFDRQNPTFVVRESDLSGLTLPRGLAVTVDGRSWQMTGAPQLDGTGLATLEFTQVAT